MEERVAKSITLQGAHRPIVEIERQVADFVLLGVDDLAEGAVIERRVNRQWRVGHAAK